MASSDSKNVDRGKERATNHCSDDSDTVHKEMKTGEVCCDTDTLKLGSDASNIEFYLFGVLRRFQYCTGHITMCTRKARGSHYIQLVKVLYCKLVKFSISVTINYQ